MFQVELSILRKKYNSIAYHFVREGTVKEEWKQAYVKTEKSCSDMLSKSLPGGRKRRKFTSMMIHHVYDHD